MKKIFSLFILMFVLFFGNSAFSYTLTTKDQELVNSLNTKIEKIIEKKGEKVRELLYSQLEKLSNKYSSQPRLQKILLSVMDNIILGYIPNTNMSEGNSISSVNGEEVIFAAGGYGGTDTNKQIDDSGHSATKFDIYVNFKNKPVVLILGAYEPTIWDISISEGTKISKIILGGYHKQVISGIDKNFPSIESHIYENGDNDYFYIGNDTLKSSLKKYGDVEKIYTDKLNSGKIIIGDQNIKNIKWIKDNTNISENYFKSEDELSGQDGIKILVKKGVLREATKEDADKWFNEIISNKGSYLCLDVGCPITDKDDLEILKKKYTPGYGYNYYVALKDFTIPAGLYGGNLSNFYIPKGINYNGNPGHSSIYDFNTLKCSGAMCAGSY